MRPIEPLTKPEWDVIVIGSGMGGSSAGAICSLQGLKTLILEKNPRPGGACSYYEKDGFHLDTGTHLFLRGNNGPFGVCTRRLGMGTPIRFIRSRKITRIRGMNLDVTIPRGKLGMFLVSPLIVWQMRISPVYFPAILRLFWDMVFMSRKKMDALNTVSIEEFLLRYTESAESRAPFGMLLSLFFVLPPWQVSAGEAIWNIRKFFREPNLYYPKGGAVAIPKAILKGAEGHGAQVRLNERVKKISVSEGRVKGVVMENGELITAHAVISTTSLKDTVFSLAGEEHFPTAYVNKIKILKGSWAPIQAKIAVRKKLVDAGSIVGGIPLKHEGGLSDEIPRDFFTHLEDGKMGEMINIYAPIPTNFDPSLAPKGCQIITAAAAAPTLDIMLKDEPSVWIEGMMNALYQIIPGLKENIIFCDTWSVENIASWMGKGSGSAITTGQTIDQVGVNRPGHRTPVRGLYIAGDCGGRARGVGTELACQSGMDCGDLVAGDRLPKIFPKPRVFGA